MVDRVGQQLGNYRLIRLLGEGGFAEVYLGEHIYLNTQAAIKVLHTQLTADDIEKFRIEAFTIAHLIHPNIVRVLEFGVEGKTPFLVMDYAPHGTLRQRHPKGVTLPLEMIVPYVKQIADALQYAHDEKLVHRDVKPENMLLGRRGEILLSDFGIALITQSSRYQSTFDMAGTMAYMAPEQIQGKPRPASDQYSLGIVVYEWLSGIRPFQGSFTEIVGQHLSVPPPPLRGKVPTLLPDVEQVIMTALAKDPNAARMELKAKVVTANFSTIISSLAAKRFDVVISAVSITPDRQKQVDFVPYFNAGESLLVQAGNPKNIKQLSDLCGQNAGVQNGTIEQIDLQAASNDCTTTGMAAINLTVLTNQNDVVQLLATNRVVATYQDSPVTDYYIKLNPGRFQLGGSVKNAGPEGIAIRKGDTSMFNAIKASFDLVKSDGTYHSLILKWGLTNEAISMANRKIITPELTAIVNVRRITIS